MGVFYTLKLLNKHSSFGIEQEDTKEVVPLHNVTKPIDTKSDLENVIQNFNSDVEASPDMTSKNKDLQSNTIYWKLDNTLHARYTLEFKKETFLGCEFIGFHSTDIYLCIITKYKIFFKRLSFDDSFIEKHNKKVSNFKSRTGHYNYCTTPGAALARIVSHWEDVYQEDTSKIGKMLNLMNKSESLELLKKMIEADDEGVFFQKESIFPISQYVKFESCICLLRDSNGDDNEPLLFALADPLEDYLNIELDSSIYDIISPSWISGVHEGDFMGNITLFDNKNKLVQTCHLVLEELKNPVDDKKYECKINPRLEGKSSYYGTPKRRATILDVPLSSAELSKLTSIGCYVYKSPYKTFCLNFYVMTNGHTANLKAVCYTDERDIYKHLYTKDFTFAHHIKKLEVTNDKYGFAVELMNGNIIYYIFDSSHYDKIFIKEIVQASKKSLKKLEESPPTQSLLRVLNNLRLVEKEKYLDYYEIFILFLIEKFPGYNPLDAFFLLLAIGDKNDLQDPKIGKLLKIIRDLYPSNMDKNGLNVFERLLNALCWYHEELTLDTTTTYLRRKLGVALVEICSTHDTLTNHSLWIKYFDGLYGVEAKSVKTPEAINPNTRFPAIKRITAEDVIIRFRHPEFTPCNMKVSQYFGLLICQTRNDESIPFEVFNDRLAYYINQYIEAMSRSNHWMNSTVYPRTFKLINMFVQVAKKVVDNETTRNKDYNIMLTLDDDYPSSLIQFFEGFSVTHEKFFCEIDASDDWILKKFYLRTDIEKTVRAIHNLDTNDNGQAITPIQSMKDTNITSVVRLLAYMHPILNNNLFNNKIVYADREKIKTVNFLRQISKPIGFASLVYSSERNIAYFLPSFFEISGVNFDIVCGFDEYKTIPCKEQDAEKILSLQFLHMAKFSTGIAKGLGLVKNMPDLDDELISRMRPEKLNVEYGGFLYGLGLNGYLKDWNSSAIYYTVVTKYSPLNRGFFLGLGSSNLSTGNELMAKIMALHLEPTLPNKSVDLNHHFTLQISALLALGLLFLGCDNSSIINMTTAMMFKEITLNEQSTQKVSFNVSAGIAAGLNRLYDLDKKNDESYNDDVDENTHTVLTVADEKGPLYYLPVLIYMTLTHLRSGHEHAVEALEMFVSGSDGGVVDLESKFYLRLFKNMTLWDISMETFLSTFDEVRKKNSNMDELNFENVMIYYELAADILSYSIMNVGMCDEQFKEIVLEMFDNLVTLSMGINHTLKTIDMSYSMKICLKHMFVIRRILLEAVSLNFCSSGDDELIQRCNFYLSNEEDLVADFYAENYPFGFDAGEPIFDPNVDYTKKLDVDEDDLELPVRRPLYYDSNRKYVNHQTVFKTMLRRYTEGDDEIRRAFVEESSGNRSPVAPPCDEVPWSSEVREDEANAAIDEGDVSRDEDDGGSDEGESSDVSLGVRVAGNDEDDFDEEESDNEAYFEDNLSDDDNVADKDSIKNKRDFIEKVSFFSDVYSDSLSASFSLGLLNLCAKQKIIDVSGSQKKLALLILSMLPMVNSFPFELQDVKYFYFMEISDNNIVHVFDGDDNNLIDDKHIEFKVLYKNGQELIKEAPFCIPKINDVVSLSLLDDKTYYPLSILGDALLKKHELVKDIKVYVKKRIAQKERDYFKGISNENVDTITPRDVILGDIKQKVESGVDIENDHEIKLLRLSTMNSDIGIDIWNIENFGK